MAFSVEADVYLAAYAIYPDAADDEPYADLVHGHMRELARLGTGVYLGDTDFQQRHDRFVTDANYARLQAVRQAWDPQGRMCGYLSHTPQLLNQREEVAR